MTGLNLSDAQDAIYARVDELPYNVSEGGAHEAEQFITQNGVRFPQAFVQFSDLLPVAKDKNVGGPRHDGYYSIFRVLVIADNPRDGRRVASRIENHLIGWSHPNIGGITKESGGGSFDLPQTNSKPAWFGALRSYQFKTNIDNVGSY